MPKKSAIKVYHGFGHQHDLNVFGHVFRKNARVHDHYTRNPLKNLFRLLRLFFLRPVAGVDLKVDLDGETTRVTSEHDGFYKAEWSAGKPLDAGWHDVSVFCESNKHCITGKGKIFIPHSTQYVFISDIDDTILVSHSATIGKRLKELMFKNPHTRTIFPGVAKHYSLLANAHTTPEAPNPFFYVSSSEWNLYDYLRDLFEFQKLPNGAFLLNQFKRWNEIFKTGKTKHEGKLIRIVRILAVFPKQQFVLFGDNSQRDPEIYSELTKKYSDRIFAVYIRNVNEKKVESATAFLAAIEQKGIHTLLYRDSEEAIEHSRKIQLL